MSTLLMTTSAVFADTQPNNVPKKPCPHAKQLPPKAEKPNIGERLNLTEEQKQKAHAIRMQGHEQIKPIFDELQLKKQELKKVEESTISQNEKDALIAEINKEIQTLRQEAKKIRIENTKQFESILTDEQKIEFEKIKQEGKERMEKYKKEMKKNKK